MKKSYSVIVFACLFSLNNTFGQFTPTPALQFDGVDDYIMFDPSVGDNVRSIELWFNPASDFNPSSPTPQTLFVRDVVGETGEWGLCLAKFTNYQGNILFFKNIGNSFHYVISDATSWTQDTWYHVAGVIDPVSGMKLYIDGVLQSSTDPNTSPTDVRNESVTIGNWTNNVGREFHGVIDEVRVWDRAITEQEILGNMCSLTQWSDSTGLIAYWKFNEGSGTVANDDLLNHNGVIFGANYTVAQYCSINDIEEINSDNLSLQVFPNPAEKSIELGFGQIIDEFEIMVYDFTGKVILKKRVDNSSDYTLNIENLESGAYYIIVTADEFRATKSLVKY